MTQKPDWADELAQKLADEAVEHVPGYYDTDPSSCEVDRKMIATALRKVREDALEEAAKIADEFKAARKLDVEYELDSMDRNEIAARARGAGFVANLIRELKSKGKE